MRFGNIVIGFVLAIVVAYIHDSTVAPVGPDGQSRRVVNWDVLGQVVADGGDWVRAEWDQLSNRLRDK